MYRFTLQIRGSERLKPIDAYVTSREAIAEALLEVANEVERLVDRSAAPPSHRALVQVHHQIIVDINAGKEEGVAEVGDVAAEWSLKFVGGGFGRFSKPGASN